MYRAITAMRSGYTLLRPVEPDVVALTPTLLRSARLDYAARREHGAHGYLESVVTRLRAGGAVVTTHVAASNAPAAILDALQHQPIDLIAMAPHGVEDTLRHRLWGAASQLMRRTPTPMLLYRPQLHDVR